MADSPQQALDQLRRSGWGCVGAAVPAGPASDLERAGSVADQDTCTADCGVEWILDDAGPEDVWRRLKAAPALVGYDPATIPEWADGPRSPAFAGLRLVPHRLRVMPGAVVLGKGGETLYREASGTDA